MILPFFAELIGTFIFLAVILNLTANDNGIVTALCIGLTLAGVVWFASKASLGSMNPAVTLALFLRGNIDAGSMCVYWVAEILGALLAFFWFKQVHAGLPAN
jgi:aquaporin Z